MKKVLIVIFTLLFAFGETYTQSIITKISAIGGSKLSASHQNKFYILNKNQIIKFCPDSKETELFSVRPSIYFSDIDTTDPLKIIAFDPGFFTFSFFDSNLNPLSNTEFSLPEELSGTPIFTRSNQAFYVADPIQNKLYIYSLNFKLQKSVKLSVVKQEKITAIQAEQNKIYISTEGGGVYIFDKRIKLLQAIDLKRFENLKLSGKYLYSYNPKHSELNIYNTETQEIQTQKIPSELKINDVAFYNGSYWLLSRDGIYVIEAE